MDWKRGVELAVLILILLLPAVALTSQSAKFRLDRIDSYLSFPKRMHDYTPTDKELVDEVRRLLLLNAEDRYYDSNGITCYGDLFLQQEQKLFAILEQLACLQPGTFGVYYEPIIRQCDPVLKKDAEELINATVQRDVQLFLFTAENHNCEIYPQPNFFELGNRVIECICGIQPLSYVTY